MEADGSSWVAELSGVDDSSEQPGENGPGGGASLVRYVLPVPG